MNPLAANQSLNNYSMMPIMNTSHGLLSQTAWQGWNHSYMQNQCPAYFDSTELSAEEFAFEETVSRLLKSKHFFIKPAQSGIHKAPILYDFHSGEAIAVFKPNGGWRTTVNWGDILAYRLDHGGFANVPLAFRFSELSKRAPQREYFLAGSFVEWIPHTRALTGREQVQSLHPERQAISILDMRLGNADRHNENILVDENGRLIPIDHDCIFSNYVRSPCACYCDQLLSQKSQEYILNLDLKRDIKILREFEVPENAVENFVIRTIFLKLAAEASLKSRMTIGDIEEIIESLVLPSGPVSIFLDTWVFHNPLKKILAFYSEPYEEKELIQVFQESFHQHLQDVGKGFQSRIENYARSTSCLHERA